MLKQPPEDRLVKLESWWKILNELKADIKIDVYFMQRHEKLLEQVEKLRAWVAGQMQIERRGEIGDDAKDTEKEKLLFKLKKEYNEMQN